MASFAVAAGAATFASPTTAAVSSSFSGLRSLRLSCAAPRLVSLRHSRSMPLRIQAAATEETFNTVKDIIVDQLSCPIEKVTPNARFVDLGADSLDTVEIMMALEEEFNIQLDQEAGEKIITVGNAADLIQEVITSKGESA